MLYKEVLSSHLFTLQLKHCICSEVNLKLDAKDLMSLKIINTQQISSEFRKLNIIPIYVHLNKSSFIPTVKASGFLSQHHMQNRA